MPKRSSIAIFIAATSALAISTADSNSVKSGENDLGGLKEWNTDMALDADFKLDEEAQKIADEAEEMKRREEAAAIADAKVNAAAIA